MSEEKAAAWAWAREGEGGSCPELGRVSVLPLLHNLVSLGGEGAGE